MKTLFEGVLVQQNLVKTNTLRVGKLFSKSHFAPMHLPWIHSTNILGPKGYVEQGSAEFIIFSRTQIGHQ